LAAAQEREDAADQNRRASFAPQHVLLGAHPLSPRKENAMKPRTLLVTILTPFPILTLLAVLTGGPNARQLRAADEVPRVATDEFKLSGPYSHRNLTIFLVHGHERIEGKKLLTLQEALEQKLAIVHETDNVTQLSIENISKDAEIFIQSGYIVKGGKQDRLISFSMIVPAQSGKVALAAFTLFSI
jgi:hypothetical protein